jgi:trimethylamine--corrinoid protein Co-methyltransferase
VKLQGFRVLSSNEIEEIHSASLELLMEVGMEFQSERALEIFHKGGAEIDSEKGIVKLSNVMVENALTLAPKSVNLYSRDQELKCVLEGRNLYGISGNGANYVLDFDSGERRPATKRDIAQFTILADALDNVHVVAPQAVPHDTPGISAPLHAFEEMVINTKKPFYLTCQEGYIAKGFIEIAKAVINGESLEKFPIMVIGCSPDSPLRLSKGVVDSILELAKEGVPFAPIPCPMAGVQSPVTIAGTLVQLNAEVLGSIVLAQLVREGTPVVYSAPPTPFDMQYANPVLGSPEVMLMRIAGGQLADYYHLPGLTQAWDTDSHCLDEQTAWESMLTTVGILDTYYQGIVNMGMIATGLTVSFEQLVIDNEIFGACLRLLKGVEVTKETLAKKVITEVGPGGNYLGEWHTHEWLQQEYWFPSISNRATFDKWTELGAKDVVTKANAIATNILIDHKPPLPEQIVREKISSIILDFEREN